MDYQAILHYGTIILAVLSPVFVAVATYSEKLALDPTTQANGIIQGRRLAKAALAIIPETVKAVEAKDLSAAPQIIADVVTAFESPDTQPASSAALATTAAVQESAATDFAKVVAALRDQLTAAGIAPAA